MFSVCVDAVIVVVRTGRGGARGSEALFLQSNGMVAQPIHGCRDFRVVVGFQGRPSTFSTAALTLPLRLNHCMSHNTRKFNQITRLPFNPLKYSTGSIRRILECWIFFKCTTIDFAVFKNFTFLTICKISNATKFTALFHSAKNCISLSSLVYSSIS